MNKHHFGEYTFRVTHEAKKAGLFLRDYVERISQAASQLNLTRDQLVGFSHLMAEAHFKLDGGINYFVDTPELADWFAVSGKSLSTDLLLPLLIDHSHNKSVLVHTRGAKPLAILFSVLHFKDGPRFIASCGSCVVGLLPGDLPTMATAEPFMAILAGMACYLSHFPEAISDGVPECAKHPAHYRGQPCKTMRWTGGKGGHHASPCGTWRLTHDRMLRSEYFTHKRGMKINVKACWVGPEKDEFYTILDKRGQLS